MAQLSKKAEVSTVPEIAVQPTRGLESYVGRVYRQSDGLFSLEQYDSSFLRERTRREALYNSISFGDLYAKIKVTLAAAEPSGLEALLLPYVVFLENSPLNPLDQTQKQKINSLFDFFKRSWLEKIAHYEREWKDLERKLQQTSVPNKYVFDKVTRADQLAEEYRQWTSPSWPGGLFQTPVIPSLKEYGRVIQGIRYYEEKFWQNYLLQYQSGIFATVKEVEDEARYLNQLYQEQFTFSSWQQPLHHHRLTLSLPYQLLQDVQYVKNNLVSSNALKLFAKNKLKSLEEDTKTVQAGGFSFDTLIEFRNKYPPLMRQFPDFSESILYYAPLVSSYEQQREKFQHLSREQELLLDQERAAERKKKNNSLAHPLIISLEPFDISAYVQRGTPSTEELQKVKKLLLADDRWERKLEQLLPLLEKKPAYYSRRDREFLDSVIFALETSQREGVLEHLGREKPALHQKIKCALSKLEDYARQYTGYS